ncbi:GntR family transcriptional regulator [Trujillonella endophytica]|uniref:DNA-binding transcriptional regulator, GntR family n=1 Tax=Trujillonella endophytica TaxID=673521 RepID=A0A1H8VYG8_9ACTN|nr:GntR family transcriptional regulator [Trujillella endophytica]SEP19968.1 DNA-binding transcriptional regulator, GntR family [Trujillella endophytica]
MTEEPYAAWSGWDDGSTPGSLRQTTSQRVALAIRRLIFEGTLPAGERIRQEELAEQLGVSRVPIREAIIALDREGWVRIEAHRGAYVNGLDENSIRDHYELIGVFYAFAARRLTERQADVTSLESLNRAVQEATDPDDFWRANTAFFRGLVAAARSSRLSAVSRLMSGTLIPNNYFVEIPEATPAQKAVVQKLYDAVVRGDGEGAERILTKTYRRAAEAAVELFAERGLITKDPGR